MLIIQPVIRQTLTASNSIHIRTTNSKFTRTNE